MNESIRTEMLNCNKNCRVNVMYSVNDAYLCWVGSLSHTEQIPKESLNIDNAEFKAALERAKKALADCDAAKHVAKEYVWNGSVLAFN